MSYKKKGFSFIDIIFAVLFVSLLSLVGLKLYLESNIISKNTEKLTVATFHASNFIESLYKETDLLGKGSVYIDFSGEICQKKDAYLIMKYSVKPLIKNLRKVSLEMLDLNSNKKLFELQTKIYSRSVD